MIFVSIAMRVNEDNAKDKFMEANVGTIVAICRLCPPIRHMQRSAKR